MVPPSHSRISRYHGWLARRPVAILVAAAFHRPARGRARLPSRPEDSIHRAAPQRQSGRGRAGPDAETPWRPVAAADRHPVARPRGQPAVRGSADAEAAPAPAHRRRYRDVPRPRRAVLLPGEQVAVRLGGRPRVDPRPAAQRDQQAQEPALRVAGRRRTDRFDAEADVGQARPRRSIPGRRLHQQGPGRRVRLDRGAAAGRLVRRERRRGAAERGQRPHPGGSARALPPRDEGRRRPGRSSPASRAGTRSSATSSR